MKTTLKGDIGVSKIITNLLEQGIQIFTPFSTDTPWDIIVYKNNKFYKVQVKYRTKSKGCIGVELRRMSVNRNKLKYTTLKNGEVDVLAIYCPDNDQCYYIDLTKINTKSVVLRIDESLIKIKTVRDAMDFKKFPVEG